MALAVPSCTSFAQRLVQEVVGVYFHVCLPFIPLHHMHEYPVEEDSPLRRKVLLSVRGLSVRGLSVRGLSVRGLSVRGLNVRGLLCAAWLIGTDGHAEHVVHGLDPHSK